MEAAYTCETPANFYRLHGATSHETVSFILAVVRTLNLTHTNTEEIN
jgi:hypothetical protein